MAGSIGAGPYGGLRFTFSVPGLDTLSVDLNRFADEVSDFRPFWNGAFRALWYEERRRDFALEGMATGTAWAPLSPGYAAWKAKHYPGAPILTRSGALRASLSGPDAAGAVWKPEPTALTAGTTVPYGIYHQVGTRRMPQRPPLRITPEYMRAVGKQLQVFVVAAWQRRRQASRADEASIQAS